MKSYGTKDGATGFTQWWNDQCCYYNERTNDKGQKEVLIVAVYVDDIQIYGNNEEWIQSFKGQLKVKWQMDDMGPLKWILGMEVKFTLKIGYSLVTARFKHSNTAPTLKMVHCASL